MIRHYLPSIAAAIALILAIILVPVGEKLTNDRNISSKYLKTQTALAQTCVEPLPSITQWWTADNISANTDFDLVGNLPAIFKNIPLPPPDGKVGKAFQTPGSNTGSATSGGYIELPNDFIPAFPRSGTSNAPFSVEFWLKAPSGSAGVIFGQQSHRPFNNVSGHIPPIYIGTDGKLRSEMFWKGGIAVTESNTVVTNGQWHHIAVTYDGAVEKIYINGGANPGRSAIPNLSQHAYNTLPEGYYYQLGTGICSSRPFCRGGWDSFGGLIDEFTVYNIELIHDQIKAIYEAGSAGKCKIECGNGLVQDVEVCDGDASVPDTVTCETEAGAGYTGTITCSSDCSSFDSSACDPPPALPVCSDGEDNDNDGLVDFPSDKGCTSATDTDETNPVCNDGVDNDSDGRTDFPEDPGCDSLDDSDETSPQCANGLDDDGDGVIDFENGDRGCDSEKDNDETNPPVDRNISLSKGARPQLIIQPKLERDEVITLPAACATCTITADPDPSGIAWDSPINDEGFIIIITNHDSRDDSYNYTILAVGDYTEQDKLFTSDGLEYFGALK